MSLVEYKSPVVKKPKFGWQRYQFGNKSAAELKLSLWDANLSEVIRKNDVPLSVFPITTSVIINLHHFGIPEGEVRHTANLNISTSINDLNELVQFLNTRFPYLGEFRPDIPNQNILLVVDKTWATTTLYDVQGGIWKFSVQTV
jgi:hypothetical protein